MAEDWDALVDAAPPEVREALDRLRHHVVLTTPEAPMWKEPSGRRDAHRAIQAAMGSVLAWAARHHGLLCPECAAITCQDPRATAGATDA